MAYENKLISVIVPIHNVEKYLNRCVKSILNQSYRNLEVILVDDGSTDDSGKICDELQKADSRVKVIHQKNQGVSGARNTGIDNCTGEYVCFVDSDDYVNERFVEYLYDMCVENGCDIGMCSFSVTDRDDYCENVNFDSNVKLYTKNEMLDLFYSDLHVSIIVVWNKIFKRECIGDIRYDFGRIHEDESTTFKFLYNAGKIAYSDAKLYYYFDRAGSITSSDFSPKRLDILNAYENRIDFYKQHGENGYLNRECMFYLSEILTNYYKVYHLLDKDKALLGQLRSKYKAVYKMADKSSWGAGRRAMYLACKICPLLYGTTKFSGKRR